MEIVSESSKPVAINMSLRGHIRHAAKSKASQFASLLKQT